MKKVGQWSHAGLQLELSKAHDKSQMLFFNKLRFRSLFNAFLKQDPYITAILYCVQYCMLKLADKILCDTCFIAAHLWPKRGALLPNFTDGPH